MGDLLATYMARDNVRGLNAMFGDRQFEATRSRVELLRIDFPRLLKVPANPGNEHPRRRRMRSLRFAASMLTENYHFRRWTDGDPSDGRLRHWLRWLSWIQTIQPRQAQLFEGRDANGNPVDITDNDLTAHDLIVRTIDRALDDPDAKLIVFGWNRSNTLKVIVDWEVPANPPPSPNRRYTITVDAPHANQGAPQNHNPNTDDDFDPE